MTVDETAPVSTNPRTVYRQALLDLAARDERVVCLDSDTGGLETTFAAEFPDRYFNIGIAEANMLGIAGGLAARGYLPYVHTMACFATMRAAEQLKLDIVGHDLPVRVIATHGGLSAAHFGTTHYALDDLALVRVLMGLTVVVPADSTEIGPALRAIHNTPGPAYLRLGRSATPPVPTAPETFTLGRAVQLRSGRDVALIAMGPYPVVMALEADERLRRRGVSCQVLQIHTLSPLDVDAVVSAARASAGIVTVEEHRPRGGLGDAVAEVVAYHSPVPQIRVAVDGEVGAVVHDHRSSLEASGVSTEAICNAAVHVIETASRKGPQT